MTFPPEKIGDKNQRYEVSAVGYPTDDRTVIGWAATREGAGQMVSAIRSAPGCLSVTVRDRWGLEPDFTFYAGILR